MNKRDLSERDISTKFITPAVVQAGSATTQKLTRSTFDSSRASTNAARCA